MTSPYAAPDEAMMRPVEGIARFMATLDAAHLEGAFADDGVTILENFAPYVFTGADAVARWSRLFRAHVNGLSELRHSFGPAQDFHLDGSIAYFALPTTWTGFTHGRPFRETGGWSFVLSRQDAEWCQILWLGCDFVRENIDISTHYKHITLFGDYILYKQPPSGSVPPIHKNGVISRTER